MSFLDEIRQFQRKYGTHEEAKLDAMEVIKSGTIGAFGNIYFEVSSMKVMTFDDFERETKGRWAKHEIIGNRIPISEYLGQDVEEISMKVQLNVSLGINPIVEYAKFLDKCRNGEADFLIIGTHVYGRYKWYLESVKLAAKHFDNRGNMIICELNLKFMEYASG